MEKIKTFVKDVNGELKKVSWPTWQELKESTIVVIIAGIILAIFVGIIDIIFNFVVALLLR